MPTGETTPASNKAKLHHELCEPARTVDMVPQLQHNSLISGVKFAEANYVTILTPDEVLVFDGEDLKLQINKDAVLRGWREQKPGGLWRVPLQGDCPPLESEYILLPKDIEEAIQNVYDLPSTKQIVRYLHACAGFPTKQTWLRAIRAGNYATWPHLSVKNVQKHFPESDEERQGHMRSIKQGIRSTKERIMVEVEDENGNVQKVPLKKHNDIYVRIDEAKETIYTDQTGAFPVRSRRGNRYIMVLCEMDSNTIHTAAMKNRTGSEIIRAYQELMDKLKAAGLKPKKHILDNECSKEFKQAIREN